MAVPAYIRVLLCTDTNTCPYIPPSNFSPYILLRKKYRTGTEKTCKKPAPSPKITTLRDAKMIIPAQNRFRRKRGRKPPGDRCGLE